AYSRVGQIRTVLLTGDTAELVPRPVTSTVYTPGASPAMLVVTGGVTPRAATGWPDSSVTVMSAAARCGPARLTLMGRGSPARSSSGKSTAASIMPAVRTWTGDAVRIPSSSSN